MNPGTLMQYGRAMLLQKLAAQEVSKEVIGETEDGTKIVLVEGGEIRDSLDVEYGLGAHGLCREYVPQDEIWIERLSSVPDMEANLAHELVEFYLMKYCGLGYNQAHAHARDVERQYRRAGNAKTASIKKQAINVRGLLARTGGWMRQRARSLGGGLRRASLALRNIPRFFQRKPLYRLGAGAPTGRMAIPPPAPVGITGMEHTMIDPFGRTHGGYIRSAEGRLAPMMAPRESLHIAPPAEEMRRGTSVVVPSPQDPFWMEGAMQRRMLGRGQPPRTVVSDPRPVAEHFQEAQDLFRKVPLPPEWAPFAANRMVGPRPVAPSYGTAAIQTFPAQNYSLTGAGQGKGVQK